MSTKRLQPKTDERVTRALALLGMLTASDLHVVDARTACENLGCSPAELDEAIALVSTLADREGGARAIVFRDHDDVVLSGNAAALRPLRLSASESAVLSYLFDSLDLEPSVRDRLARALLPADWRDGAATISGTTALGPHFAMLARAIEQRERCTIGYRSHEDHTAHERYVEPLRLETVDGVSYLIARKVPGGERRRYRLDRISKVTVGEPSSEHVAASADTDLATSLRAEPTAIIELADGAAMPSWAGLEPLGIVDGRRRARICVASRTWLFGQLLSAQGALRLVEPQALVRDFITYARGLVLTR